MNSACFLILLPAQGVTPTRFCFALRDVDYHLAYRHSFVATLLLGSFGNVLGLQLIMYTILTVLCLTFCVCTDISSHLHAEVWQPSSTPSNFWLQA